MKIFSTTTFVSALVAPVAAFPNFTYVGIGLCADGRGNDYEFSYMVSRDMKDLFGNYLYDTALVASCTTWCGQNDSPKLNGLMTSGSHCYCLFSDGFPVGLTYANYSNPQGTYSSVQPGVGPVFALKLLINGHYGFKCFRNMNFGKSNPPTSTPTKQPTNSPVTSNPTKTPVTALPTESPSEMPSLEPSHSFQGLAGKSIDTPNCSIDNRVPKLTCSTTTNPASIFTGAALFISLVSGECQMGTEASVEGTSVTMEIEVNQECKNAGMCTSTNCLRIDVKSQGISILASMYEVMSALEYDTEGVFSATVQTAEFMVKGENVSMVVTRTLSASIGECGSTAEAVTPLEIGSTAAICISSDDGVMLSLKSVVANPGNQVLVDNGVANFLTTFQEKANPVTLSTLMVPIFYDLQPADVGSITLNGTASIIYSRRLKDGGLLDKVEDSEFLVEIPLASRGQVPDIPQAHVEQKNVGLVLRLSCVAKVVFTVVVGMMF